MPISQKVGQILCRYPRLYNTAKKISGRSPKIVSFSEGFLFAADWAKKIPNNFDAIVGVPRNGLLIANVLASAMGKPLSTPDCFMRNEVWFSKDGVLPKKYHSILLVEDAIDLGRALNKAEEQLHQYDKDLEIKKASLFVSSRAKQKVDYYYASLKGNSTIFEWNLLTATGAVFGKLAVDMDGVLCVDCPPEVDADEDSYVKWIENVEPFLIPAFHVDAIVTSRLEKYRPQTEKWLKANGVKYGQLIMLNLPDKTQRTYASIVDHKVKSVCSLKPNWFWESSLLEAKAINKQAKIPVLCTQKMKMIS
jgi:Uncharacterized conserved protein